jgi:hypothetical protein
VVLTHADSAGDVAARPPRISALLRPAEAIEAVHALYRDAFALPFQAWRPGEATAFDDASRAALARARNAPDSRAALGEVLAAG